MNYTRLSFEKLIGILMLAAAIAFNIWLYRLEPTAGVDPNDNAFQYALVDRENTIWTYADTHCPHNLSLVSCHLSLLADHWVPNWAEGYNLPYYYSHIPQIVIVGTYRTLSIIPSFTAHVSLFRYYHLVIYLLLCLFPLSVFVALRVIGTSFLTAGIGALFATQLSTDGLYGLDPSSFLWRGYGLSSQLFAMIFLPQAIAYSWKYFTTNHTSQTSMNNQARTFGIGRLRSWISDGFWPAVFYLFATTAGHLGIGIMAFMSLIPLTFAGPLRVWLTTRGKGSENDRTLLVQVRDNIFKLVLLSSVTLFFLSYWIIPILLTDNYHNISFWDPVWKFNSYGAKETMIRLLNGDLFDFGRFPTMTLLTFVGFFAALRISKKTEENSTRKADTNNITIQQYNNPYFPFALLFIFWLLLYFGRTTWGSAINLIPGMKDFHLSRFIVGLQLAGLFLAPVGLTFLTAKVTATIKQYSNIAIPKQLLYCCIVVLLTGISVLLVYPQTINYNDLNNTLILRANANFDRQNPDVQTLFSVLRSLPPGRVYSGRGGWWGKELKIAETPYYMQLSTYGIPTVLWLPETWSPNSDTEQYFREDHAEDYDLYNINAVVAPPSQSPQPFWKLYKKTPAWNLFTVQTDGYITSGVLPAVVSVGKRSYVNVVRLWIQSDLHKKGLYPEITFAADYPKQTGLPNFRMTDEADYRVPDGSVHSLFQEPPVYLPPGGSGLSSLDTPVIRPEILSQSDDTDMVFHASVRVPRGCRECLVILKQSSHPDWVATVDGKTVPAFTVFPFYVAVSLAAPGIHTVTFAYQPSRLKVLLLSLELVVCVIMGGYGINSGIDKLRKTRHAG
ncbi:hypothetical protein M1555_03075 [Patescibacteria group bacterium]|nr:hypothetical protein [Patescibacteria group bacterium]